MRKSDCLQRNRPSPTHEVSSRHKINLSWIWQWLILYDSSLSRILAAFNWSDIQEIGAWGVSPVSDKRARWRGWPNWAGELTPVKWERQEEGWVKRGRQDFGALLRELRGPEESARMARLSVMLTLLFHWLGQPWGGVASASTLRDQRCGDRPPLSASCSPLSGASPWLPQTRLSTKPPRPPCPSSFLVSLPF